MKKRSSKSISTKSKDREVLSKAANLFSILLRISKSPKILDLHLPQKDHFGGNLMSEKISELALLTEEVIKDTKKSIMSKRINLKIDTSSNSRNNNIFEPFTSQPKIESRHTMMESCNRGYSPMNFVDKTSQSSYKSKRNANKDKFSSKYTLSVLNWQKYTGSLEKGIESQKLKFNVVNDIPSKAKILPKYKVPHTLKAPFMSNDEIEKDIKERTGFQDPIINSQGMRKDMKKAQNLIKQSLSKYQSDYLAISGKQKADQNKYFGGNYLK